MVMAMNVTMETVKERTSKFRNASIHKYLQPLHTANIPRPKITAVFSTLVKKR
jgi:hypothetical protein